MTSATSSAAMDAKRHQFMTLLSSLDQQKQDAMDLLDSMSRQHNLAKKKVSELQKELTSFQEEVQKDTRCCKISATIYPGQLIECLLVGRFYSFFFNVLQYFLI